MKINETQRRKEKREDKKIKCDHEYEVISSRYTYEKDTGQVYKIWRNQCKKCGKVKNIKTI